MVHEESSLLHTDDERAAGQQYGHSVQPNDRIRPTPLPWRSLLILQMLTAVQPLAFDIIFPFVNQMILEIGVVDDPKEVGFYSGLIESSFSIMSFMTVLPISHLADIVGRKPVVLGGLTGLALSINRFGMSKSFSAMIISRCLAGAMGGVSACTKVMMAELTDKSNQNRAFQMNMIAYRIGQIIGLPLGGILAHPERNFPIFRSRFWYEYPFALPCFVAAGFTVISVICGTIYLKETLHRKQNNAKHESYRTVQALSEESSAPTSCHAVPIDTSHSEQVPDKLSYRAVLTAPVVSILLNSIAMCFASEALFAVFPLFSFTPMTAGGLGMSEATIGTYLAIRAVLHIGMMPFCSYFENLAGSTVRLHCILMWTWPMSILCMPLLNLLARVYGADSWILSTALTVYFIIWSFSNFTWLTASIMVTDASPSPEALSTINGLSQLTIILPQAIAPAFVTALFAFSIESSIAGGNLIWIILFIFTLMGGIHSMTLRQLTSSWR